MLSMVAVVPQPPLIVPELTAHSTPELDRLRTACLQVTEELGTAADDWLVLCAAATPATGRRSVASSAAGSFVGYGVDERLTLAPRARSEAPPPIDPGLPLPLLVAGWLRGRAAPAATARAELVAVGLGTSSCRDVGRALAAELASDDRPTGLLVVGDGAATHTEKAPGYLDRRAEPFDAAVSAALAAADAEALLTLDAGLADELHASGRAPWQVLAGLVLELGGHWRGELRYSAAPYGVGYHAARWDRSA